MDNSDFHNMFWEEMKQVKGWDDSKPQQVIIVTDGQPQWVDVAARKTTVEQPTQKLLAYLQSEVAEAAGLNSAASLRYWIRKGVAPGYDLFIGKMGFYSHAGRAAVVEALRPLIGSISVRSLATECGLDHNQVYGLVANGVVPAPSILFAGRLRYPKADLPRLKALITGVPLL